MNSDPDPVGAGQWEVREAEKEVESSQLKVEREEARKKVIRRTRRVDKRRGAQDRVSLGVKR